jgi:dienelactone hydrolase
MDAGMKTTWLVVVLALMAGAVRAFVTVQPLEIKAQAVAYQQGETTLEGWLVYNAAVKEKRPGVLVVHQWKGLTAYEKKRAEMLAELGYVVLCADIYGKGVRPQDNAAAGQEAGKFKQNRALLRDRVQAGLAALKQQPQVDAKRVAAIGYCFGGTTVIELARSGAELAGVVSFHGGLDSPTPADGKNIRTKVLVLHGADDPYVPAKDLQAFEEEMRAGKVDWQLVKYGGAVHSFTDWNLKESTMPGAQYNESADRRSWEAMQEFFAELFR